MQHDRRSALQAPIPNWLAVVRRHPPTHPVPHVAVLIYHRLSHTLLYVCTCVHRYIWKGQVKTDCLLQLMYVDSSLLSIGRGTTLGLRRRRRHYSRGKFPIPSIPTTKHGWLGQLGGPRSLCGLIPQGGPQPGSGRIAMRGTPTRPLALCGGSTEVPQRPDDHRRYHSKVVPNYVSSL